jgi:hypothetical protein
LRSLRRSIPRRPSRRAERQLTDHRVNKGLSVELARQQINGHGVRCVCENILQAAALL